MKPATLQDIASQLGISSMTVSRALRNHPEVSPETRRKVLQLARKLHYRPNRWARSLITRRSNMIGLVLPDISHAFFSDVAGAVQEALEERGYGLLLCRSNRNAEIEMREIDMLLGSRVDGLIVASEQPAGVPGVFGRLKRERVHFVLIDRYFPALDCPRFVADDVEIGRLATRHLLGLGRRRIAHVRGPETSTGCLRLEGYLEALRLARLPVRPELIVEGSFSFEAGRLSTAALLKMRDRPDAIFAANDLSAFGAVQACREAGLDVPCDVPVVGTGNIEGDQHPCPFLTTTTWNRRALGQAAARSLLSRIEGRAMREEDRMTFPPALVVRRSSAAEKGAGWA